MATRARAMGVLLGALLAALAMLWGWRGAGEPAGTVDAGAGPEPRTSGGAALGPRGRPERAVEPRLALASVTGTVRDAQGRPIAGAQVCARARAERLVSQESRRIACAVSERDGHYRIAGLLGVRHVVTASAPGFIPGPYFSGEVGSRREWVDLRAGQERREVDITLQDGGVEVHGVVRDLSGGAVEGAQVTAGHAFAVTGADGQFSLWSRPGSLWLWAQADGYAPGAADGAAPGQRFELFLTPEAVLIGKVVRADDGSPVEGARVTAQAGGWGWNDAAALTDAGGRFRLDGLEPGAYKPRVESDELTGLAREQVILGLGETSAEILVEAHPAFLVEGKIVTAAGEPCDSGGLTLKDHANSRTGRGEVEADGLVRVRGLLPGEFQVEVRCPGHIPAERYERVTVGERSVTGLRWEVTSGRAIRGTVVGADGKGIEGLNVRAIARADPDQPRAQQTNSGAGSTDAEGRFALRGLLAGAYEVLVTARIPPRATPDRPTQVRLPADRDVEDLRIVLPASGALEGSVRDAQGRPVQGLTVMLSSGKDRHRVAVADDGDFRVESLAPGDYRATVTRKQGSLRAPGRGDDDLQGEKVTVRAGATATVRLVVAGATEKIAGVVRDEHGGPVADAFVEATLESDSAAAASGGAARNGRWASFWGTPNLSDTDGRFTLTELAPGKHTLRAHRKGGGEAILEHVEAGSDVVLTIAATGRMAGTVHLGGGGVPEDFQVGLEDEKTGFRRGDSFFRTGGAWSFSELPAGTYKVRVGAGAGSAEIEATMTAGQDTTGLRVELAAKVTVRGTVVDLEGKPVPGLSVSVGGAAAYGGGDEHRRNITDAAGRYEVAQAPTGKVHVWVGPRSWGSDEWASTWMPAVIATGEAVIELPPIRVSRRRVRQGEVVGDLGLVLKQAEPGADPLLARQVIAVVRPGGPAAAAGLVPGDEIVSVDGNAVTGPQSYLYGSLTTVVPGTALSLGLARGATVQLTAGAPP